MEQACCKEGHQHNTVSKKDRLIMLLMAVVLAVIFLRPVVVLQNIRRGDSFLNYGFYDRVKPTKFCNLHPSKIKIV